LCHKKIKIHGYFKNIEIIKLNVGNRLERSDVGAAICRPISAELVNGKFKIQNSK